MTLRLQLIFVSLLALVLPWSGCTYLKEMEGVLRQSQQDALLATARSAAVALEKRPDLLEPLQRPSSAATRIYLNESGERIVADGYAGEWPKRQRLDRQGVGISADYSLAADSDSVWLLIEVNTAGKPVNYHDPTQAGIANGDHIRLLISNPQASNPNFSVYWLAPEAPGEINAKRTTRRGAAQVPYIEGEWRETPDGFLVELEIDRARFGDEFGFEVSIDDQRISTLNSDGYPGRLLSQDDALNETLADFGRDNLKLSLIDTDGWVIASSGELDYRPEVQDDIPPGTWMLEYMYRFAVPDDLATERYPAETPGRIRRAETREARDSGEAVTAWYNSNREPPSAIVSAAVPLDTGWVGNGRTLLVAEQTTDQLLSLTNAAMTRLLLITFIAMFTIVAVLLGYATFLSVRIRRLNQAVNDAVKPDGTIRSDFPATWGNDEIGELGDRFGDLIRRVREYNEYLRTLADKLSHEMRTPIAIVNGSLDNYLETGKSEYLDKARDGTQRLSRMVNAITAAKRMEDAIASSDTETVNLNILLSSYAEHFDDSHEQLTVTTRLPDQPVILQGSEDLLSQMLEKLLDNAISFCPDGGNIQLSLEAGRQNIRISVSNDGPLLPAEMGNQLFDMMISIRDTKTDSTHLGLGLTVVRLVAEFHEGSATAENREDDSGVTFTVTLPLKNRF